MGWWYRPILAQVLASRLESFLLVTVGIVQVGLTFVHLPGWPCPIKAVTGIPCPGCGLSSAATEFLHGHWQASFTAHAFAPFFLAALILMSIVLVTPKRIRDRIVEGVEQLERKTGATAWFLTCFMMYWGLRVFNVL